MKKKFVGDNQIDGDKILLEQGQSIKAKDATNVEQDILKFGPAGEVLVGAANDEVALKGESVQKVGDTMEGPLVVDQATGVTSQLAAQNLSFIDSSGVYSLQVAHATGFEMGSDDGSFQKYSNVYDGGMELSVTDATATTQDGTMLLDPGAGINYTKLDHASGLSGQINVGLLGTEITVADGANNATTAYLHDSISVSVNDGSGDNKFVVQVGQPVQNIASDGSAPTPTLDSHLASKKYVDDQIAAESGILQGNIDAATDDISHLVTLSGVAVDSDNLGAFSGSTLSSTETIKSALQALEAAVESVSGGGSSTQLELDATQVGAGLEVNGSYVAQVGANYIQVATSLKDADTILDTNLKLARDDISTLQSEDLTFLKLDGSRAMTGNLNMMNGLVHNKIVGLADPTDGRDAVNKQYVDAIAEGLHVHAPVKALISEPIPGVVTYDNGSSGQGATLTLGTALTSVDDYSLQNGDRVIVSGQANQAHNGIYTWATGGTVLTRAEDFNSIVEAAGGDFVFVQEGTQYGNTGWVMTETTSAIGTSPIIFLQFSGAGSYTAGDALSLNGTEFNVLYDDSSIGVNPNNEIYVKQDGIGTFELANDSVTNDKIADNAVAELQISSSVAGFAMEKGISGKLDVKVDGTRIGINPNNQLYIPSSGVGTFELANDSVTNDKIADNAVSELQISSAVAGFAMEKGISGKLDVKVDGTRIAINPNNQLYIPSSGVGTFELANDSVTNDKIADNAVSELQISSAVAGFAMEKGISGKLDVKVDGTRIAINPNNQLYIPSSGVGTFELANDSVTNDKIADNAVAELQISSSVAGNGIEKEIVTGKLQVKLDGASLAVGPSGLKSNIVWDKAFFDLTATDISNGYVELPVIAEAGSIIGFVDRLAIHEDQDFTVQEVSGKSRIIFTGDLIPPGGSSPLDADDSLFFKFQKKSV